MGLRKVTATVATLLALSGSAQATLYDRGGGMIYDDVLNITWLWDWKYSMTSGYDADGMMTWADATTWVSNLVYGGFSDWRLPSALNADGTGPCHGWGCTNSEMGHMFYGNWGATAFNSYLTGSNTSNLVLFTNVQVYWASTDYPLFANYASIFNVHDGNQIGAGKWANEYAAVAVRDGDVISPVPEPQAYILALVGLGTLLTAACRRRPADRPKLDTPEPKV